MEQLQQLFQKTQRRNLLQRLAFYLIVSLASVLSAATASAQVMPITIRADRLLDGVGGITENVTITVERVYRKNKSYLYLSLCIICRIQTACLFRKAVEISLTLNECVASID